MEKELDPLIKRMDELSKLLKNRKGRIELVERAIEEAGDDATVRIRKVIVSGKRSLEETLPSSCKRVKGNTGVAVNYAADSDSEEEDDDLGSGQQYDVLNRGDAARLASQLKTEKQTYRDERSQLKQDKKPLIQKANDLSNAVHELTGRLKKECIQYRNEYCRPAIQRHFANGIKE